MPKEQFENRLGFRALALSAASVASIMSAAPALAQSADSTAAPAAEPEPADGNQDIVVTAQFRSQRLQDTPIAITAISGADIEKKALSNIADVGKTAPNVNIEVGSSAYGTGAAIFIRGIGQYDTNFALEPGVGVYVDDVYHGALVGSIFDLLDLDRVEILRGPQGTLAGKNSIGGAVKLYSRKPEGSNEGYVQATTGSYGRIDVRGAFDLKLDDDFSARFSAFSKHRQGFVDIVDFTCEHPEQAGDIPANVSGRNCRVGKMGGVNSTGARLALRYQPDDRLDINIIGSIVRDDSQAAGEVLTYANCAAIAACDVDSLGGVPYDSRFLTGGTYRNYATFLDPVTGWHLEPIAHTHMQSISGEIEYKLADHLSVTSITAYEDLKSEWTLDDDLSPINVSLTDDSQPYHQFTQELRLNGDVGNDFLEYTVGGFYFNSLGRVQARVLTPPLLNFIEDDPVKNRSIAGYGQAILHPIEGLSLIAGIRYTDDRKSYTFYRADPQGGPAIIVGSLSGLSKTYKGDSWDYRLGADYRISPELLVYGNFSTGYKGGGVNPRPFIPSQVVPFNPERVDAYEAGFKSDLFGRALRFNAAAFLNKYRDIILIDANGYPGAPGDPDYFPASAVPFNAGKATIKGLEGEITLRPAGGFSLSGSVSYLDFKYKDLDPNATASGIGPNSIAPFTPKWKWSFDASYEFDLPNGATITPQYDMAYMSSVYTDPVNASTNLLAPHTVANATLTFQSADRAWQLVAGVTNLFDKYYYTNAFDLAAINGLVTDNVGRPREFFVSLRRNFK